MNYGRTIRVFLVDGSPIGIVMAEVMSWTGQVLTVSRTDLSRALIRPEAKRQGVYLLLQYLDPADRPILYVGESDNVAHRIEQHDRTREFDRVCIITSKDANLTKAHVLYLESRLLELIDAAERAKLSNNRGSDIRSLPEADVADMEYFLSQLQMILPVVGFDFIRGTPVNERPLPHPSTSTLKLQIGVKGQPIATAVMEGSEVTVLKGSRATKQEYQTNNYKSVRDSLLADGRLADAPEDPAYYLFAADVTFQSPSAAAAVVLNRNSNGRTEWRLADGTGRTLKDWQEATIASAAD